MANGTGWAKSSHSNPSGNCVEWSKSSHSFSNGNCVEWRACCAGGECVQVAAAGTVRVRDSKNPGPELVFTRGQWTAFVSALKSS